MSKNKHYQIKAVIQHVDGRTEDVEVIITYNSNGKAMCKTVAAHIIQALYFCMGANDVEITEQCVDVPKLAIAVEREPTTPEEILERLSNKSLASTWDALNTYHVDDTINGIPADDWAQMVKSEIEKRDI